MCVPKKFAFSKKICIIKKVVYPKVSFEKQNVLENRMD